MYIGKNASPACIASMAARLSNDHHKILLDFFTNIFRKLRKIWRCVYCREHSWEYCWVVKSKHPKSWGSLCSLVTLFDSEGPYFNIFSANYFQISASPLTYCVRTISFWRFVVRNFSLSWKFWNKSRFPGQLILTFHTFWCNNEFKFSVQNEEFSRCQCNPT